MSVTLHQCGYYEGDVREKEIERDKGTKQRKKMVEEEQREYRKLGELTQHFQILVEGGGALASSTPREGTHSAKN